MYQDVPESFARRLRNEFGDRYRLRWSVKKNEWHLEQRVGPRNVDDPFRIDEGDDTLIRARDGYTFVLAVKTDTRMECPASVGPKWKHETCGFPIKVPIQETAEAFCEKCRAEGRDGRWAAGYWPLDTTLIQYIRRIDYSLGHNEDLKKAMDVRNANRMAIARKDELNSIDDISYDIRKTFGAIEQVGYGKSIIRKVGNTSY